MKRITFFITICFLTAGCSAIEPHKLDVSDFGAIADGKTDCTKAFQNALDKAAEKGLTVFVPAGKYAIKGTLKMPYATSLEGTWQGPHFPHLDKGSTLLAYAGREDESSIPFIQMGTSCTLTGFTIYYPEQKYDDIKPYPWTIQAYGSRFNIYNMTFVNSYNGIDCGTKHNAGHNLRDIQICALRRGIYIDRTTDVGRIENIHVHAVNWWRIYPRGKLPPDFKETINKFTLENLEGFIIGRCDWEYMNNCFVIWPKIGFHFVETIPAADGSQRLKGYANIVITQSGSDIGPVAVKIEKIQDHAGISFENSQFMNGIEISEKNTGPLKLSNCGFWGMTRTGAIILNRGKGTVMVNNSHFSAGATLPDYKWDPNIPFIQMYDGALMMNNCLFKDYGHTPEHHILIDGNTKAVSLTGTTVQGGTLKVKNHTKIDIPDYSNTGK
ncbi:MAG: hypothetical protein J7M30_10405 [Deltaproteobacteria bacterium]|nr:hypothetical protein [Deltaproteobacteria bacterium]